jgi:putative membrane protein insertion efficiency factor
LLSPRHGPTRPNAHDDHDHQLRPAAHDGARRSGRAKAPVEIDPSSEPLRMSSRSLPARGLLGLLRLYRVAVSPAAAMLGRCRHEPSCSAFAEEAVRRHGAWVGGWMALARLARCRPGGSHGYDPVPVEKPRAPWWAPWEFGDWRGGLRPPPPQQ